MFDVLVTSDLVVISLLVQDVFLLQGGVGEGLQSVQDLLAKGVAKDLLAHVDEGAVGPELTPL